MHELKAHDELFLEDGVEYEDYLKGLLEYNLEKSSEHAQIL